MIHRIILAGLDLAVVQPPHLPRGHPEPPRKLRISQHLVSWEDQAFPNHTWNSCCLDHSPAW